jgi:hypothetical protein
MARNVKFAEMSDAIRRGLENLKKWYRKVDDTDCYFVCLGTLTILIDRIVHSIDFLSFLFSP